VRQQIASYLSAIHLKIGDRYTIKAQHGHKSASTHENLPTPGRSFSARQVKILLGKPPNP